MPPSRWRFCRAVSAKARRVIYLHMAGAPSQLELFEHKPELIKFDGKDCPAAFLTGNALHSSARAEACSAHSTLIKPDKNGTWSRTGCPP